MADRNIKTSGPLFGNPRWAGDFMSPDNLVRGGAKVDDAQFPFSNNVKIVLTAAAAAAALSIAVQPLQGAVPSGTVLDFGFNKFAKTNAIANIGDVAITVLALPVAMVAGDQAQWVGTGTVKEIKAGTIIGRTTAERDAGAGYGPGAAADDELRIVAYDVSNAAVINDVELYRPGRSVKENFLPEVMAGTLAGPVLTALRLVYQCTTGQA